MARPSKIADKRRELLPIIARTFAEFGYRRATTAELARRCDVQENILYRLWRDKKQMFIAAIGHVYDQSIAVWERLLAAEGPGTPAERLLAFESRHHGEFGRYRIVFAGLGETDDPEIRAALADMYTRYQRFLHKHIAAHRATRAVARAATAGAHARRTASHATEAASARRTPSSSADADGAGGAPGFEAAPEVPAVSVAAWGVVGLGTIVNIGRELGLLTDRQRRQLLDQVGRALLGTGGGETESDSEPDSPPPRGGKART